MGAALIFLAGALAAPDSDRTFAKEVLEAYPTWAVREEQETSFLAEIAVLPDGSVAGCGVVKSVGNARLAAEACQGTIGKKLKPATASDGAATFGLIRTIVTLTITAKPRRWRPLAAEPDLELSVNRLPEGAEHLDVVAVVQVSPDGSVAQCEGLQPREGPSIPANYVNAACAQAKELHLRVVQDASGSPVSYVTRMQIRFGRASAEPAD